MMDGAKDSDGESQARESITKQCTMLYGESIFGGSRYKYYVSPYLEELIDKIHFLSRIFDLLFYFDLFLIYSES